MCDAVCSTPVTKSKPDEGGFIDIVTRDVVVDDGGDGDIAQDSRPRPRLVTSVVASRTANRSVPRHRAPPLAHVRSLVRSLASSASYLARGRDSGESRRHGTKSGDGAARA